MEKEASESITLAFAAVAGAALLAIALIMTIQSKGLYRNEHEFEMAKVDMASRSDLLSLTNTGTATGNDLVAFMTKHTGEYFYAIDLTSVGGGRYLLADDITGDKNVVTNMGGTYKGVGYIAMFMLDIPGSPVSTREWGYYDTYQSSAAFITNLADFEAVKGETEVSVGSLKTAVGGDGAKNTVLRRWTSNYLCNTIFSKVLDDDFKVYTVTANGDRDNIVGLYLVR